ncbi:hypothetical protein VVD49_05740 [Uliginosibacterium sp. H3]|uniref:Uncharacterized protein n=1 Tax=Uliginosibacterium silvisoli TaxID=3114758 RepID=A0ABU6K2E5_9RHOO|nr:hypothetical protein [Uliginosibacterium sp. H3]
MRRNAIRCIAIAIACCTSIAATAADACDASAECVKAVSMIGPIDSLLKRCVVLNPDKADAYRAVLFRAMNNPSPEILEMIRASDIYARTAVQVDARLDRLSPDRLREACEATFKPAA